MTYPCIWLLKVCNLGPELVGLNAEGDCGASNEGVGKEENRIQTPALSQHTSRSGYQQDAGVPVLTQASEQHAGARSNSKEHACLNQELLKLHAAFVWNEKLIMHLERSALA